MSFKIGDKVTWTSSSNGVTKTKTGTVEVVIPAGERPTQEQMHDADSFGWFRHHQSYMVRVPGKTERSKGKLYWPIARKLKKA